MAEKLPFTFTPNIVRYLKEMIEVYERRNQGVPKDIGFIPFSHKARLYSDDEPFYSFSEPNRKAFIEYVSKNGAAIIQDNEDFTENYVLEDRIEFLAFTDEEDDGPDVGKAWGTHPWDMDIWIDDIRPVLFLWQEYLRQKSSDELGKGNIEVEQMSFDQKEARLMYRNKSYSLHKGKSKKPLRLRLFEKLWDERMHVVNGETTRVGKRLTASELINRLGVEPGKTDFYNLEAALQRKQMPIRIEKVGDSVLLVVNENI